jgi:uncharacterized protein (TIGR00369 family)
VNEPSRYGWTRGEGSPPPYLGLLGLALSNASDGEAVVLWTPPQTLLNNAGFVQGGFIAAALDLATAVAAATIHDDVSSSASVRLTIEYFRPVRADGGILRVFGKVVQRSRNWTTVDASISNLNGKMLARGQHLISVTLTRRD